MSGTRQMIRVGAPVTGALERAYVADALRYGWLAQGPAVETFENRLSSYFGSRYALVTNSGSSALMLAVASSKIRGDWQHGDEVIICALGFPTAVTAILLAGLRPVFVDCDPETLTIDVAEVERAISARTRAILVVHPIGNVADMTRLESLARRFGIVTIEDACDAFGSHWEETPVGSIGTVGALSFYASHHISTGEGGAVLTNVEELASIASSLRAWGRVPQDHFDYRRSPGAMRRGTTGIAVANETLDYDIKFSYQYPGFNFKMPEVSAALGCAQIEQAESFARRRADNYATLLEHVSHIDGVRVPNVLRGAAPSWMFGCLLLNDALTRQRATICGLLEDAGIETRPVLAGNLVRQRAFAALAERDLPNADTVMRSGFCVGVHQGLAAEHMKHVGNVLAETVTQARRGAR